MAGERLAQEAERAHVERATGVGVDAGMLKPAVAAELRHEVAARYVNIAVGDRQMCAAPTVDRRGEAAVALVEKRPGEEALVRHQSPSKVGCSLATKAR
jgi:hypothetical protein